MSSRLLLLVSTLTLSASLFAWSPFGNNFDPDAYGEIVFGVDAPYPPYAFFGLDGQLTGFEVELGNKACEYLGASCRWQTSAWDDIIPRLLKDDFDIIMSSMSITDEREQQVDFGKPYYAMPAVFFARKGENIGGSAPRHLAGKVIAVQGNTVYHDYLLDKYDGAVIMALNNWDEVEAAFRSAEADVVFTDYKQWEDVFFLENVYEILGDVLRVDRGIGLAFRKNDDDLREAMNQVLNELKSNGEYERIRRKYFFFDIMIK